MILCDRLTFLTNKPELGGVQLFLVGEGGVLEFRFAGECQDGNSLAAVASEPMLEY